ncbi:MAG: response regulator [Planctomycetota bacterium]
MDTEKKSRILAVDDDPKITQFIQSLLEHSGYEVNLASNGHAALERYQEQKPDLVITDILMPGMGGLELMKEIRKQPDPPKVIVISGGDRVRTGDGDQCGITLPYNPAYAIAKPFRAQAVLDAIEHCLQVKAE